MVLTWLTLHIFFQEEFDTEEFDSDEFVERLAWRTLGGGSRPNPEDFAPLKLHGAFESAIKELQEMNMKIQKQVETLESNCKEEAKSNQLKSQQLLKHNQVRLC